jgi:gliding motility-associated-like protein
MKPISISSVITFLFSLLFSVTTKAQFGTSASAVWISNNDDDGYYNTSGSGAGLIGPLANVFENANFGVHAQNSGTLVFRGGEVRTNKAPGANVCGAKVYYRIYALAGTPGVFNTIDFLFAQDCDVPSSQFPSGGSCVDGDQKWDLVIADGVTIPYSPVDLTSFAPGNYVLEVYYEATGSSTTTTGCNETISINNTGNNYKAYFSIQSPSLTSANPSTCNGSEGSVTINGLIAGATYSISYFDDGITIGPNNFIANGSGQIVITGLNAGTYSDFSLTVNGITTELNTGVVLSNPVITPKFNKINPICAGATPPTLPTNSNNGIAGTWSPSVINNQTSGSYTFTPTAGQCAFPITINVTVNPMVTPTFSFGTSLTICNGGTVPTLPNVSSNSITGTWSPATVSNTSSNTYTFTPTAGQCANPTTFTVTVNPNITPTFSFGTSLTICEGASVPTLTTTSDNGITGTWSLSAVDNQASGTYTFTPTSGQCATTASFTVNVNPNVIPVFSFGTSLSICAGGSVPTLPSTSDNGIAGSWNPAVVDNQASATYTFTPTAGLCAVPATFAVTVAPNITPTFAFGTSLTICAGGIVPTLPTTSDNGITGTWNAGTVDNQNSATYMFTPTAGQCATIATFSVTVNPNITPTFSFGTSLNICAGGTVPVLPTTSTNNITGTWSPAIVDNQNSGTYTFTPGAGQCATTTSLTVTVTPNLTPTFSFGNSLTICAGGAVPSLPNTSDNGVTGTWSPAVVDNQVSGVYTFTPTSGQCALQTTFTVTVTPNVTPAFSFGTSLSICTGGNVPSLPNTSTNNITGIWSPAIVDNQNSGTYTFTPNASQCALPATFTVTVNPIITPSFSFGTALAICAGGSVPNLPATSDNGINGTWSPSTIDNQNSGTYTFTPAANQCATATTFTVNINSNTTSIFSFGPSLTICEGGTVPTLPASSDNGVTGTWSPSTVSNTVSATYTFTPDGGQCALTATFTVTVNPNIIPAFSFGTSLSICDGATPPALPTTSDNGITGTWNPASIDNQNSGNYTFTPAANQCALATTLNVTVNPIVTPSFSFGNALTICAGSATPSLPTTSDNGITGTWSPATVNNQNSASYTFTPSAGQCANEITLGVTVTPNTIPVFSFGTSLIICAGSAVPALPNTSDNGVTGTWSSAVVDNQTSGVYTFTPDVVPGQCIIPATFTVTVNPILTPTFTFGTSLTICSGTTPAALPTTSTNGITGTWSPAVINNQTSGTYTFTSAPGQCATPTATLTVTVNPTPTVNAIENMTINDGTTVPATSFSGNPNGVGYNWTNSNTAIGLGASGTSNVPSFKAANMSSQNISSTITVTPTLNGCNGSSKTYTVTVVPLNKDVFVPNVFTPNGDGKNDLLLVYGNYINKLEMRIFNQWGQQIESIADKNKGWDGRYKGKAQPVGVYVYTLQAELSDGRTVKLKGYINLIR